MDKIQRTVERKDSELPSGSL